jgi:hypothetical protein
MTGQNQPHRLIAILGYVGLVVALPIALFGLMPANEYTAWGGAGIDCDGPGPVLLFGTLGLAIYGAARSSTAGISENRCGCWSPGPACWSAWR